MLLQFSSVSLPPPKELLHLLMVLVGVGNS